MAGALQLIRNTLGDTRMETIMRSGPRNRGSDRVQGWSLELRVPQLGTVHTGTRSIHPVVRVSLRVDGILWEQVPTLESAQPDDPAYVVSRADDGTLLIDFGDGQCGSRLPTGVECISAFYRAGCGSAGKVPQAKDTGGGESVAYVDVWTTEVAAIEDAQLREPALGGPDTSIRGQCPGSVNGSGC